MDREYVGVVMLPSHKEALRRIAEENGEAMSVTVRRLIREEAQRQNLWPATATKTKEQEAEIVYA